MKRRLIESYELPYLDPMRLLPVSMVQHLTKHDAQALSPAVSLCCMWASTNVDNVLN